MRSGITKIHDTIVTSLIGEYTNLGSKPSPHVVSIKNDVAYSDIVKYIESIPDPLNYCNCQKTFSDPDDHEKTCPVWLYTKLTQVTLAGIEVLESVDHNDPIVMSHLLQNLHKTIQNVIK